MVGALGPPEILVNVAGGIAGGLRAEDEPLDGDRADAAAQPGRAVPARAGGLPPHGAPTAGASIVNVSSISGLVGIPGIPQASYAASKAGLSGLTVELAVQWARHRIRVNTVAPGFFRSEITEELYDERAGPASGCAATRRCPTRAPPTTSSAPILWLVGDAGRYVTGQTIVVDGGWTAR